MNKLATKYHIETEILFVDENAEKFGSDPKLVWGTFYLDIREIIGFWSLSS